MTKRFNSVRRFDIKETKRKEAAERQAIRDKRTITEQLEHLRNRPGASLKETARLMRKIAENLEKFEKSDGPASIIESKPTPVKSHKTAKEVRAKSKKKHPGHQE